MPDSDQNIWIDTSFLPSDVGEGDVTSEIILADSDNIGGYSMPTVFVKEEVSSGTVNTISAFINSPVSEDDIISLANIYFSHGNTPLYEDYLNTLLLYSTGSTTISGFKFIPSIYTTGFNPIYSYTNVASTFVGGRKYGKSVDKLAAVKFIEGIVDYKDYYANYINFSGNLTPSGIAIPYYDTFVDKITSYQFNSLSASGIAVSDVDISFAGWVDFPFTSDIFSVLSGMSSGYTQEIKIIPGGLPPIVSDLYSTDLEAMSMLTEVYSTIKGMAYIDPEIKLIPGNIENHPLDVYSCTLNKPSINCDISLQSLKISNFSLGVGEYTVADDKIYVDVTDDLYNVTTSGTYFKIGEEKVNVSFSVVEDGYRMYYDPEDNFLSLSGPTSFVVHAENDNGVVIEEKFYLTYGYKVVYDNVSDTDLRYGYDTQVAVRVTAENMASWPQGSSAAYTFETRELTSSNLTASIVGKRISDAEGSLMGSIRPISTTYFYGSTYTVEIKAKDFHGNPMEPFKLTYTIEDKLEN